MSLHMSHFTAFFLVSFFEFAEFQDLFSPGPGPEPNNNQDNKSISFYKLNRKNNIFLNEIFFIFYFKKNYKKKKNDKF